MFIFFFIYSKIQIHKTTEGRQIQLYVNYLLECCESQISQFHLTGVPDVVKPPCDPLSAKVSFIPF